MKNLTVIRRVSRFLESLEDEISNNSDNSRILHTVDSINDDFYLLLKSKLYKIPSDDMRDIVSFDIDENLKFVNLEYCSITQEIYAACKSGDIMRINVEPEFECESMNQLNVNLQCMKLSPDHEMIVIVTSNGTVITMVSSFHIISEVTMILVASVN